MTKINCIIVDDDEIDRLTVFSYAKKFNNLNILGVFEKPNDALYLLENEKIDLLFLDIDMPGINGMEVRKKSLEVPVCIFITSHPEFALESFDLITFDFIVKPIRLDRFAFCMTRVEEFFEIKNKALQFESILGNDVVFIKEGHQQTKVKIQDILYLEALKDYTLLVTDHKRHCILSNLGNLLKEAHFSSFLRVHRSYAVQKQYIKRINSHDLLLKNDYNVPIGRAFKYNLNIIL